MADIKVHVIFTTSGAVITQGRLFAGPQIIFYESSVEVREFYDTPGAFTEESGLELKEFQIIGECQMITDETGVATFFNEVGNKM